MLKKYICKDISEERTITQKGGQIKIDGWMDVLSAVRCKC